MQNIVIYPYSLLFAPFLRQLVYDKNYNIISVIMPGKWYENGIDASYVDEGELIGVSIFNNFEEQIDNCTTILWAEYDYGQNNKFINQVIDKMISAIKKNKNIICCQKLKTETLDKFVNLAKENNVKFDYLINNLGYIKQDKKQEKITVPVITVMGAGENCSKFETQLILRRIFLDAGYKISQIGSREGCEILEFRSFPQFMFCKDYTEIEKIDNFYNLVIDMQNQEKPDIFIIGVPGAIMPLNDKYNMNYGITAFEIFNSIKPDFNIINLWCQNYNNEFINQITKVLEYRFNTLLDCVCMSNLSINNENPDNSVLEYDIFRKEKITEHISGITNKSVYNTLDLKSHLLLKEQIIAKLS